MRESMREGHLLLRQQFSIGETSKQQGSSGRQGATSRCGCSRHFFWFPCEILRIEIDCSAFSTFQRAPLFAPPLPPRLPRLAFKAPELH